MILTDQQHDAMLHALGYFQYERNYYVASTGSDVHAEWMELVKAGLAERRPYQLDERGSSDLFKVTEAGIAIAVKRSIERSGAAEPRAKP